MKFWKFVAAETTIIGITSIIDLRNIQEKFLSILCKIHQEEKSLNAKGTPISLMRDLNDKSFQRYPILVGHMGMI